MVTRYECLQWLATRITNELIVTNLGGVSREWYGLNDHEGNLYRVQMCGATPAALGLALSLPKRKVISLDGDGSMLMGLSVLPVIAQQNPPNLTITVFDNQAYEAAGKIPTFTAGPTDLAELARAAGIPNTRTVKELTEFQTAIEDASRASGTSFIVVKVEIGSPPIPFAAFDGIENKYRMVRYIEKTEDIRIIQPPAKKL